MENFFSFTGFTINFSSFTGFTVCFTVSFTVSQLVLSRYCYVRSLGSLSPSLLLSPVPVLQSLSLVIRPYPCFFPCLPCLLPFFPSSLCPLVLSCYSHPLGLTCPPAGRVQMTRGLGYGYGRDSDVRSDTQVVPPDPGQDYESRHMDVRRRREEE